MRAKLLWSNRGTAVGTTLKRSGHSAPIDLSDANAVWLAVTIGDPPSNLGSDSHIRVEFKVREDAGVWIPVLQLAPIQRTSLDSPGVGAHGSAGLFLPASADGRRPIVPMVLPETGRVSWILAGKAAVYRSTTISLYGR